MAMEEGPLVKAPKSQGRLMGRVLTVGFCFVAI